MSDLCRECGKEVVWGFERIHDKCYNDLKSRLAAAEGKLAKAVKLLTTGRDLLESVVDGDYRDDNHELADGMSAIDAFLATLPEPEVCEWRYVGLGGCYYYTSCKSGEPTSLYDGDKYCRRCGRKIKVVEGE
jgi:hypothetical protein